LQSGDFLYNKKDCGDDFYSSSIIGNARCRQELNIAAVKLRGLALCDEKGS
jgi:hypothetical protein